MDITSTFIEQKSIGEEEDVIFDEDEIVQVTSGGFHTLVLIKKAACDLKVYGLGKLNKG